MSRIVDIQGGIRLWNGFHARLVGLGFTGTERTTRRAVAQVKAAWLAGNARTYRPRITEPRDG